jgi:hypothetical protein
MVNGEQRAKSRKEHARMLPESGRNMMVKGKVCSGLSYFGMETCRSKGSHWRHESPSYRQQSWRFPVEDGGNDELDERHNQIREHRRVYDKVRSSWHIGIKIWSRWRQPQSMTMHCGCNPFDPTLLVFQCPDTRWAMDKGHP